MTLIILKKPIKGYREDVQYLKPNLDKDDIKDFIQAAIKNNPIIRIMGPEKVGLRKVKKYSSNPFTTPDEETIKLSVEEQINRIHNIVDNNNITKIIHINNHISLIE